MYGKYALGVMGVTKYHTACTAYTARTALKFFIVKTSRQWCLGFNWIRRKISRKRGITEGGELTKGRNVQLTAVHIYSQCSARGVRGAVFRDIDMHFMSIKSPDRSTSLFNG